MTSPMVDSPSPAPPLVLSVERVGPILEGLVESRSEDRKYQPRFVLNASLLCTCPGSIMRDSVCVHLKALLEQLDAEELRQFIIDSQRF